ncbi:MAG: phosphoribosylglycinamide formyltransferase [Phycisphaerales bacterium]
MTNRRSPRRPRLAVFLSGSGRTLVNLHEHVSRGTLEAELAVVVASKECVGAERARGLGLGVVVHSGVLDEGRLLSLLDEHSIDWVVLAGYLKLLPIPARVANRVVNIHPALLPAFGGAGMFGHHVHEAVLAAGCKVSGCTVHLCDARYDRGPIVLQRTCEVRDDDTADTLAARVFEQECIAYPDALRLLLAGRIAVEGLRTRVRPG